MAVGFDPFAKIIDHVAAEMGGSASLARLKRVAGKSKDGVDRAVRADIGDLSMSGWKRKKPIQIRGVVKVDGSQVSIQTSAQGPMRVLQQGRNQGNSGGMAGPGQFAKGGGTVRKKNGQVKATRARKAKRWNGYTVGKDTWADATEIMTKEIPRHYQDDLDDVLASFLTRG